MTNRIIPALASVSALALAAPAWAQGAPATSQPAQTEANSPDAGSTERTAEPEQAAGDIIVTAQRREERAVDVPISITVANQTQLERQQVNTLSDLARVAPALEIQQAPGQSVGGGGQVRGIGTQSFQQGAVGSVGIVVDQVSQGNVNISDLFDIARVEVLKGPQGTLFGLTTSAGVINITTNEPEFDRFSARARTELSDAGTAGSEFGRQVVQALVNIPISANAGLRVSGNYNATQGVDYNRTTNKLDRHESYGARGRFLWEPTEDIHVNLIGDYSKTDDKGRDFFTIFKANAALTAELAQCGIVAGGGNRDYCTTIVPTLKSKTYGGSLQIDLDADPFTLTSITAMRRQSTSDDLLNIFRLDPHAMSIVAGPTGGRTRLATQEFRVSSPGGSTVEYTIGAFASTQRTQTNPSPFRIQVRLPFPPFPVITPVSLRGTDSLTTSESLAFFGQGTYHLGEHLRLIAGGRFTSERLGVRYTSVDTGNGGRAQTNIENFSWRTGAQYVFDRNIVAYATVSKGYKGPQIALGDPSVAPNVPQIIRPEIPTSYEAGIKANLADGRLLADLSGFYTRVKDYQGQLCTPNTTGGLRCVPQNIGRVVSKGLEANITGRVFEGFSINAGGVYNAVHYPGGFVGTDGSALGGRQLTNAPKWKFSSSGEYSHPLVGSVDAFIAGDAIYKSSLRLAASTDPNVIYSGHWTLGGRLGVRGGPNWSVAVFGRNLTNNHEPILRFINFPDGSIGSYGQLLTPTAFRQVGLQLDARF